MKSHHRTSSPTGAAGVACLLSALMLGGCAVSGAPTETGVPEVAMAALPTTEDAVTLETATGAIRGTLMSPVVSSLRPVALIIAGSGPTDRNGNSPLLPGANNSLRMLAEGLAARGVATLRYDKRGIGQSAAAGPREEELRFGNYVDDAVSWVEQLRRDPRFSSVSIVGHSEGALIGALAADRSNVAAYVSVAGVARSPAAVLRDQLRPQLPPPLWQESERILGELEAGRLAAGVPTELGALYRASVQPYLISWFAVSPTEALRVLDMPVLIAQGTTDMQVGTMEAHALQAALPSAKLFIVEGMNHVLKMVPADPAQQAASYSNPDLPVPQVLLDSIAAHIRRADRR